jgi:hypothetical protein
MKKVGLFACLLAGIAGIAMAGTKSFNVTLVEPTLVGSTQLKPGDYTFKVEDQKLLIKHGRETTEANVKLEDGDTKFANTRVIYDNSDGKYKLQEICVGGTHTRVVLGSSGATEASSSQRP